MVLHETTWLSLQWTSQTGTACMICILSLQPPPRGSVSAHVRIWQVFWWMTNKVWRQSNMPARGKTACSRQVGATSCNDVKSQSLHVTGVSLLWLGSHKVWASTRQQPTETAAKLLDDYNIDTISDSLKLKVVHHKCHTKWSILGNAQTPSWAISIQSAWERCRESTARNSKDNDQGYVDALRPHDATYAWLQNPAAAGLACRPSNCQIMNLKIGNPHSSYSDTTGITSIVACKHHT